MRHFPGWIAGALGTAALVGAFYAGGALKDTRVAPLNAVDARAAADTADVSGVQVECEPGQRAVVRQASLSAAGAIACVTAAPAPYAAAPAALSAGLTRVAYEPAPGYTARVATHEPIEVYRPRAVPASYRTRPAARPARSVQKSVAIIAGSTAVGATVGGLTKGKKGAVIGGLIGGGAATVWDQVTRRRGNER